jgi:hypothetical protein
MVYICRKLFLVCHVINVQVKSPILYNYLEDKANGLIFDVNGHTYVGYYLFKIDI